MSNAPAIKLEMNQPTNYLFRVVIMRFSLVAASLAAAATAAPMPKNSIDIDGLVGVDTSVKRSAEPDSDLHVGQVNVIVRDGEGVISDAEDAFSKFTDEATSLAETASKRSAVAEQDAEHNLVSLGNAAVSVKRDAAPEEDTLVSGTLSVGLKRDEISDLEGKLSALLGDAEGLVKRDDISDAESAASDLISDAETAIKAAE